MMDQFKSNPLCGVEPSILALIVCFFVTLQRWRSIIWEMQMLEINSCNNKIAMQDYLYILYVC